MKKIVLALSFCLISACSYNSTKSNVVVSDKDNYQESNSEFYLHSSNEDAELTALKGMKEGTFKIAAQGKKTDSTCENNFNVQIVKKNKTMFNENIKCSDSLDIVYKPTNANDISYFSIVLLLRYDVATNKHLGRINFYNQEMVYYSSADDESFINIPAQSRSSRMQNFLDDKNGNVNINYEDYVIKLKFNKK